MIEEHFRRKVENFVSLRRKTSTMVDKEEARLSRMGLTKLTNDDTFVEHEEEWEERNHLYESLKASRLVDKKPAGNFFEVAAPTDDKVYVSCHLSVPIVVIKAKT